MAMKLSITEGGKNLLVAGKGRRVPRTKLRQVPILQVPVSPLLSNFEKWAGKKRKLYFENEEALLSSGIQNYHLDRNVFAQLLASPMRCDRITRLKLPKDMMMQLKLIKLEPSSNTTKYSIELVPQGSHLKSNRSSYVPNKKAFLQKNMEAAMKWIPLPALLSDMRHFSVADVKIDRVNFLSNYEQELRKILDSKMPRLHGNTPKLQNWDILVSCSNSSLNFELSQAKLETCNDSPLSIVKFNLSSVTDKSWTTNYLKKNQNHSLGIVLRFPRDKETIYALRSLICFHST
ncbi:hypothetical protein HG535_0B06070 [Zygotorulaspora mrakii]|uniref:Required for respiratory growth protein 8, mitochondrial n=1 Tax=Zygotorulaspora mrakii TaxID=42260 RepID=A0A7H9AZB9_ZYGMR|nr:uncharacterized protein HG535_0B06070 [Zygotorulaspora mrakii]QLG71563.1 hypothetical protein HG535_0B06070 [Zygotorulaspora mrakii]